MPPEPTTCSSCRPPATPTRTTTTLRRRASFANYGPQHVDLAAPGVNILSTVPVANFPSDPYAYWKGGSMAAPQVSGAAALLLATGYQSATALKARLLATV